MGVVAIKCSKCGCMKYYKGRDNFTKDFNLDKTRPICIKCAKKGKKK